MYLGENKLEQIGTVHMLECIGNNFIAKIQVPSTPQKSTYKWIPNLENHWKCFFPLTPYSPTATQSVTVCLSGYTDLKTFRYTLGNNQSEVTCLWFEFKNENIRYLESPWSEWLFCWLLYGRGRLHSVLLHLTCYIHRKKFPQWKHKDWNWTNQKKKKKNNQKQKPSVFLHVPLRHFIMLIPIFG